MIIEQTIYSSKQAARAQHTRIAKSLKKLNVIQYTSDTCLFTRNTGESKPFVTVYVDDILIAGKNNEIKCIIQNLRTEYDINYLGELHFYLGIK